MNSQFARAFTRTPAGFAGVKLIPMILLACSAVAFAQSSQLSLADLLIALRSKKVSIEERNSILSDAVASRGITFALTPEIEKELASTGASPVLIESIRKRSPIPITVPPDFSFYEKRAGENVSMGYIDQAISDYSRAIELNPKATSSYSGRAALYFGRKAYDAAIADYTKVLENDSSDGASFARRGAAWEMAGNLELAEKDLARAVELDGENAVAKANLARVRAERDKIAEKLKPQPEPGPVVEEKRPKPDYVDVGTLTESHAVRMVKPIYAQTAARANIGGRVTVEVTLDVEGKVTSAKAIAGHQMLRRDCEDAARRSQFKPAVWEGEPIAGKGQIIYNFVANR